MSARNTQFSIAIHLMVGLGYQSCDKGKTSGQLAASVNTSPSFVRRIVSKLSKAGLVHATTGKSGSCALGKRAEKITLLEIYQAVEAPEIFAIHEYPVQKNCPVSCHIYEAVERVLDKTQKAFEMSLAKMTLMQVIVEIKKK